MSRNPLEEISNHTLIGGAVRSIARQLGSPSQAVLDISGAASSGETFTINGLVYELLEFTTAAGTATGGEFNNTTNPLVDVTLTAHGAAVGDFIMMESEFMEVIKVTDANTVNLARGAMGSTPAAHIDTSAAFLNDTSPTAGTSPIGLEDGTTASDVVANVVTAHNAVPSKTSTAAAGATTDEVVFTGSDNKLQPTVEAMANGAFLTGAAMQAGNEEGAPAVGVLTRTIQTGETAGGLQFAFNFAPSNAQVIVAGKVYDGAFAISGNVVAPDNAGAVDIADADVVTVIAYA